VFGAALALLRGIENGLNVKPVLRGFGLAGAADFIDNRIP
jgi:hypothetical protein